MEARSNPRRQVLALDFDETLASEGRVAAATLAALERLRASGRKALLVTGRELDDLARTMPQLEVFERVVAENGALVFTPGSSAVRTLASPPPSSFVELLRSRGVEPLSMGRVIVATREPHEATVLQAIRDLGLELEVIFNKGSVMVLPTGVNKGTGLRAALAEITVEERSVVGVGDAENDHSFLNLCGIAVAMANAIASLKSHADLVTSGGAGAGVVEVIDRLIQNDLADVTPRRGERAPVG